MQMARVLSWIIVLCGLWEAGDIVAPFVPGFGNVPAFVWNHVVVGIILVIAGGRAALTRDVGTARRMGWIAAVAGAWLIVASPILRTPAIGAGLWNDIVVGVIVCVLGVSAALFSTPRVIG